MIKAEWTNDDALSTGHTTQTNDSNALNALDCISRQAAIEAIEEYADRLQMVNWKENPNVPYKVYSLNWCINTIRDLPSIDAVPVDSLCEKLNEAHNEGYDVGYWAGRRDYEQKWILCSERLPEEEIEVVTVDKDGEYEINHIIDEEDGEWFWGKPVAWMSLPKPYERKES